MNVYLLQLQYTYTFYCNILVHFTAYFDFVRICFVLEIQTHPHISLIDILIYNVKEKTEHGLISSEKDIKQIIQKNISPKLQSSH